MPDKPGKVGGKRIGGVKQTTESGAVEETKSVSDVGSVKKTAGVGGIKGTAGATGSRKPMTLAEREKLFGIISEEAEKLLKKSGLSAEQQEIIENAVKMAVDTGLSEDDDGDESSGDSKKKGKRTK